MTGRRIWIDVTTVASLAPPAVGVPRVELNLAAALLAAGDDVEPCLYDGRLGRYVALTRGGFRQLLDRYRSPLPAAGLVEFDVHHGGGVRGIFARGDVLVTCGFNWRPGLGNMPHLYALRDAIDLVVVAMCHDLVPILFPQLIPGLADLYAPYLADVARHADHVLCNSRATERDLAVWSRALGIATPSTSVMPLGVTIPSVEAAPATCIAGPFLLVVGTVETRKNQDLLRRAYTALVDRGVADLPALVIVGQIGHGGEAFVDAVRADPRTRDRIVVLPGVADHELAWLYRRCRFTLYPSLYEGWGLPLSESLAYGKLCVASDRGALPEAGGDFCDYVDRLDVEAWAERIVRWVADPVALAAREADIAARYRPRTWAESATHVRAVVDAMVQGGMTS